MRCVVAGGMSFAQWPLMYRAGLLVLMVSSLAVAEEPSDTHEAEKHEGAVAAEHEAEPFLEYALDLAVGVATFDSLVADVPADAPPESAYQRSSFFTTSLLIGAEHRTGHFTFGARIPVLLGVATVLDTQSNGGLVGPLLGNLELEISHHDAFDEHWSLDSTLEFALPTAMGEEPPLPGESLEGFDHLAVRRGELLRAAEFSRGSLDSTLFEPGRIGFIPKLGLEYQSGNLRLRPQLKLETLVSTKGLVPEPLILELIVGLRASYTFAHIVEPNVHIWTNLTLTNHIDRDVDVVLVEPGVRFHVGSFRPSISVVVPVFGRLVADTAYSVRVGLSGEL